MYIARTQFDLNSFLLNLNRNFRVPFNGYTQLAESDDYMSFSKFFSEYNENHAKWQKFMDRNPVWYNTRTNIAYIPLGGICDSEYLKAQYLYDESNVILTTSYPESAIRWTIINDPVIRFAINYKFYAGNPIYNITGHPRDFFMVGSKAIESIIDSIGTESSCYPFKFDQTTVLNQHRVDLVLTDELVCKSDFLDNSVDSHISYNIKEIAAKKWNWLQFYEAERLWTHFSPFNILTQRQWFVEESVHYYIINNPKLLAKLKEKYKDDYNIYKPTIADADTMRYDHYWAKLEEGVDLAWD
jgi:hypothetical protein|tara:strand:+ start:603 stop:1499 length:897 start_codon:yes stop_codon:yes gene_type:complete